MLCWTALEGKTTEPCEKGMFLQGADGGIFAIALNEVDMEKFLLYNNIVGKLHWSSFLRFVRGNVSGFIPAGR